MSFRVELFRCNLCWGDSHERSALEVFGLESVSTTINPFSRFKRLLDTLPINYPAIKSWFRAIRDGPVTSFE